MDPTSNSRSTVHGIHHITAIAGDAQQNLVTLVLPYSVHQGRDGGRLVAGRLVVRDQLERGRTILLRQGRAMDDDRGGLAARRGRGGERRGAELMSILSVRRGRRGRAAGEAERRGVGRTTGT